MTRSAYNYINKLDWEGNGTKAPAGMTLKDYAAAISFASSMGWIQGAVGTNHGPTTSLTWGTGTVTVVSTAHGLVTGQKALIVGVTPVEYNGYVEVTVTDADTFTYALTSNPGAVTVQGKVYKAVEVIVAIRDLAATYADAAVVPTFTAAITYSGTLNTVTGDVITVTLTASEAVEVTGTPVITLTIAGVSRNLTYDAATSTGTSLKFKYTVVAGDAAPVWSINHAYALHAKYLHSGTWYDVTTAYTSGSVYDNLKVTAAVTGLPSGSGFRVGTVPAVTFTGGTQVVAPTATATISALGVPTAIAVTAGGEYSVAPTGVTLANPAAAITAATWLANVATITAVGHGFLTGYSVVIAGVTPAAYNGTYTITKVDADTFTYALVVADPGAGTVFGTGTSVVVQPTVTPATAAIDTPNVSATTTQVVVGTSATGANVSDILRAGSVQPATVTFSAPSTTLTTAN